MTRTWAFANNKGGTGKSTLCATLAYGMARRQKRVLLVDLTSQMTASSLLLEGVADLTPAETVIALLQPDSGTAIEEVIYVSDKGLDVIPSHYGMATVVSTLVGSADKGHRLQKHLDTIAPQYDFIFIDSPGDLNELMANALAAADQVMIPTRLNRTDFQCAEATLRFIREAAPYVGEKPVRVVVNMLDDRYRPGGIWHGSHTGQLYQRAQSTFAQILSSVTIPDSSDIRTAFDRGLTVLEYRPDCVAAQRIEALLSAEIDPV